MLTLEMMQAVWPRGNAKTVQKRGWAAASEATAQSKKPVLTGTAYRCAEATPERTAVSLTFACAVKRRWSTAGESPARELFAPPGSNRSSSGGNEAAEASGVEGRVGDLASL